MEKIIEIEDYVGNLINNINNTSFFDVSHYCYKDISFFVNFQAKLLYPNLLMCYNEYSEKLIVRGEYLNMELVYELPYGERSKYAELIMQINDILSEEANVNITAYNDPIKGSKSFIYFQDISELECEKVRNICTGKLHLTTELNSKKIFTDMIGRHCNSIWIPRLLTVSIVEQILAPGRLFLFPEEDELRAKGYEQNENKRQKCFISYSHKDKIIIDEVVGEMKKHNINFWWDEVNIEYGENILDAMLKGLSECDIGIIFISENYKESTYGKKELNSFFKGVIQNSKKWIIIRLDEVNPDDIAYSLSDYKYYEYNHSNINPLVEIIKQRSNKISRT